MTGSDIFAYGTLWVVLPAVPLVLASLLIARPWREMVLRGAPFAALPALIFSLTVPLDSSVRIGWLLLEAQFAVGSVERWFLLLASSTWFLAGMYGRGYITGRRSSTRFYTWFLLAMSGNFGLILAQDVVSFYFFFALMTYSAFGLVVHERTPESKRAGRVYITLAVAGEMLIFAAFAMLVSAAGGSLLAADIRASAGPALAMVFLVVGFAVKAGALPVHVWLPLAHPAAPTPASAVLSASMIKAGLLAWTRFLPVGEAGVMPLAVWGMAAGITAAFFGVVVGLTQRHPKVILAYSSISQMGLMTVAVGAAFLSPEAAGPALLAVGLYALHHALAKSALFLGVGMGESRLENRWSRNLVIAGLLLPALALVGAPLTSGAIAKGALKGAMEGGDQPWLWILELLLSLAAVGTTVLLARFLVVLKQRAGHREMPPQSHMWTAWGLNILGMLLWVWLIPWEGLPDVREGMWNLGFTWTLLWPVLLGIALAGIVFRYTQRRPIRRPVRIPVGDILALVDGVAAWSIARGLVVSDRLRLAFANLLSLLLSGGEQVRWVAVRLLGSEGKLANWNTGGVIFLLFTVLFFVLLRGG